MVRPPFILPLEPLARQFERKEITPYMKPLPQDVGLMVIDSVELRLYGINVQLVNVDLIGKYVVKSINKVVAGGETHAFITIVAGPKAKKPTKQMLEALAAYALGLRGNRMCGLYPQEGKTCTVLVSSDRETLVHMEGVRDTVRVEQDDDKAVVLLSSNGLHVVFESEKFEVVPVRTEGGIDFVGVDSVQRPTTLFDGRPVSVLNGAEPIATRFIFGSNEDGDKKTLTVQALESTGIKSDTIFVGNVEGSTQLFAQIVDSKLVFCNLRHAMNDLTKRLQCRPTHY